MALGAFLLVLGLSLSFTAQSFATLATVNSPYSSTSYAGEGVLLIFLGALIAAIGGAVLAWGIGTKEAPIVSKG